MELDFLQKVFVWLKDRLSCDLVILNYKIVLLVIICGLIVSFSVDKFITNKIYNFLISIAYLLLMSYIVSIFFFNISTLSFCLFPEKLKEIWKTSSYNIDDNKIESNAVILDCKNIKQEKDLCTTASAEIVLRYYNDYTLNQKEIKALAENKKYDKDNFDLFYATSFVKLVNGLSKKYYKWKVENVFFKNEYINKIESEINHQRPVIASALWEVQYKPLFRIVLHSVVIYGYDKENFYILDPTLAENGYVKINKELFEKVRLNYIILTKEKHILQRYFIVNPIRS